MRSSRKLPSSDVKIVAKWIKVRLFEDALWQKKYRHKCFTSMSANKCRHEETTRGRKRLS